MLALDITWVVSIRCLTATFKAFWMRICAGGRPATNRLGGKKMATMNSGTSLGTDALRVVFERQRDRFAHQIFCSRGDDSSPMLISQEGKSDDAWPPSPALQSLHLET